MLWGSSKVGGKCCRISTPCKHTNAPLRKRSHWRCNCSCGCCQSFLKCTTLRPEVLMSVLGGLVRHAQPQLRRAQLPVYDRVTYIPVDPLMVFASYRIRWHLAVVATLKEYQAAALAELLSRWHVEAQAMQAPQPVKLSSSQPVGSWAGSSQVRSMALPACSSARLRPT
jgi:hypothetical protein